MSGKHGTLEDRFWRHVNMNGPILCEDLGQCWLWTAYRNRHDYGRIRQGDGKMLLAHVLSWKIQVGPVEGLCVLHACDNPPCVRPDHLFLGTRADNSRDCVEKGRAARGAGNGQARLTEADVVLIRALRGAGTPYAELAERFSVAKATVKDVAERRTWRHVA